MGQGPILLHTGKVRFRLDTGRKSFMARVIRCCSRLPREVVVVPPLKDSKGLVGWGFAQHLSSGQCPCLWQGSRNYVIFEGPFQPKPSEMKQLFNFAPRVL